MTDTVTDAVIIQQTIIIDLVAIKKILFSTIQDVHNYASFFFPIWKSSVKDSQFPVQISALLKNHHWVKIIFKILLHRVEAGGVDRPIYI